MAEKETQASSTVKTDDKSVDLKVLFGDPQPQQKAEAKTGDVKAEATKVDDADDDDDETSSPEDAKDADPKTLQSQLEGLTKELNRVRKSKTESSLEVQELREQLANVQGQLEVMARGSDKGGDGSVKLAKYSDDQLVQGQTEWEEEILDARDAMRKARTDNDDAAYQKASKEAGVARSTLNAIRKELLERTKRVGADQARAQSDATEIVQEVASLYDKAYTSYPDLKDRDSEIWKAGNEVYARHGKLMKQLGPLGELVAVSVAITENPELVPGSGSKKATSARKELLSEINDRAEKSMIKGGGTTKQKTIPDFKAMPKDQFERVIHAIKMGE